ncbi:hypothetical protein U9M48_041596 [Paspalum notatum var. saurae]|uniref:Uncharacterized protein n=1 Tax=Paspalum notatum var. saurae TaxID=547442 RepID=A0AAQ3UQW3_PASNO
MGVLPSSRHRAPFLQLRTEVEASAAMDADTASADAAQRTPTATRMRWLGGGGEDAVARERRKGKEKGGAKQCGMTGGYEGDDMARAGNVTFACICMYKVYMLKMILFILSCVIIQDNMQQASAYS